MNAEDIEIPYTFTFYGREVGAIGISYEHTVTVLASTAPRALAKLYDTHEHISGAKLIRVGASEHA